jgi:hypothetical protein
MTGNRPFRDFLRSRRTRLISGQGRRCDPAAASHTRRQARGMAQRAGISGEVFQAGAGPCRLPLGRDGGATRAPPYGLIG